MTNKAETLAVEMSEHPEFFEMEISDKQMFDDYLKGFQPKISELTFTNLFCWRKPKAHQFTIYKSHLVTSFFDRDVRRFYQPVGPHPQEVIKALLEEYQRSSFERVEEGIAKKLQGNFSVEEDRDMFDYVYSLEDLKQLEGRKYSRKRNFIKRFEENQPRVCSLEEISVESFLELEDQWCRMKSCETDESSSAEDYAVREALTNHKELEITGVCVFVKDRLEGFAIGEPLNNYTYVEHFEKANTGLVGIYPYILNQFARSIPESFKMVNREQDLGVEGLRKAKQEYFPAEMVKKYRIRLR